MLEYSHFDSEFACWNIHILIPQFTPCIAIEIPGRRANDNETKENDFASSDWNGN
jgi:hypothetical protein